MRGGGGGGGKGGRKKGGQYQSNEAVVCEKVKSQVGIPHSSLTLHRLQPLCMGDMLHLKHKPSPGWGG